MKTLIILSLSLTLCLSSPEADQKAVFIKILKVLCVPSLAPDLYKKARDCEEFIPQDYHQWFKGCASLTLGVPELVLPLFCYQAFPGAPQLTECIEGREKQQGMTPETKKRFSDEYSNCLLKAI